MQEDALTQKQQRVLSLIEGFIERNRRPPTVRDITRAGGFKSPRSAQQYIAALVAKGALVHEPGLSRGLRLARQAVERGIPLVGRVQAGAPILAEEHIQDWVDPSEWFAPGRRDDASPLFAVLVQGDSMRDAGILDGDTVIVQRQDHIESGQIAVVYVDGEVTVKRVCISAEAVTLEPANSDFSPMVFQKDGGTTLDIAGPVVGVMRRYT
jgi:repressor LexA